MARTAPQKDLEAIFRVGLERVNPYSMITQHVRLSDECLFIDLPSGKREIDLKKYDRILLIGAGKASGRMALAFEDLLGDRISGGLVCVKYGHTEVLKHVEIMESAHPVPDENSVLGAKRIAALAEEADERTLVINCISGGGSAILSYPMDGHLSGGLPDITLDDKQAATGALLRSGASIQEINCIRKHISGIKGGRLVRMLYPARSLNFILSDVIGDDLGSIASGMTSYDTSTFQDALEIIDRRKIRAEFPKSVLQVLEAGLAGRVQETLKKDDEALNLAENLLIGTNRQSLVAAGQKAGELGYNVRILTAQLAGEAKGAAKVLADVARDVAVSDIFLPKPACVIVGGETVVTLKGQGKGGRNQEMALAFLDEMSRWNQDLNRVFFLAASTDGNDGPTDAAGAFADADLLRLSRERELSIAAYLENNDSYHFFEALNGLLKTGPTNTNVCDLQIVLVI